MTPVTVLSCYPTVRDRLTNTRDMGSLTKNSVRGVSVGRRRQDSIQLTRMSLGTVQVTTYSYVPFSVWKVQFLFILSRPIPGVNRLRYGPRKNFTNNNNSGSMSLYYSITCQSVTH